MELGRLAAGARLQERGRHTGVVQRLRQSLDLRRLDEAEPWKDWPGDLEQAGETVGLWLHATEPSTLSIFGLPPTGTSIELRAGWNLVGYPSQTARTVSEALASIAGKYTLVRIFDATDVADPWKEHDVNAPPYANDLTVMEPGRGYWLYVTEDCTWSVGP